jgi:hypothetical protein
VVGGWGAAAPDKRAGCRGGRFPRAPNTICAGRFVVTTVRRYQRPLPLDVPGLLASRSSDADLVLSQAAAFACSQMARSSRLETYARHNVVYHSNITIKQRF